MAQIAQQDDLVIEITGALDAMNETTKQKLIDCIKGGTIFDVIVISTEAENKVNHGNVSGYMVDTTAAESPKYTVAIMNVNTGTTKKVRLN